ncbi:MAG TPA: tripartite tricarboxylate transporter permease [Alphaproteobacteria bacterium]|jgi:TctA family transporter
METFWDVAMLDAASRALLIMLDPLRLFFLFAGVILGLILGILPGIGGIAGTALLLPFTFDMDPYSAFAFLLGLGSVTATGDTIPAVLFGVPGGAGSAATVLDGLPMAKKGEAGRALSAAYMASLVGGVFGAVLLAVCIPILRPVMLYIGSPELLSFAVFGMSMVAVLSGSSPLRGLAAACFGVMIAMIGSDPQTGTLRWTMGSLYLWDGMPIVPVALGLFALPELADLAIARTAISGESVGNVNRGAWSGIRDVYKNWWLVLRCSWIGAGLGAVPGIGASIIDWVAYGHALKTEKGASHSFGTGDVRGVIASESSNNAKEGGALVPTIAFGVPGSASMAILLGAFLIHGLIPGPDMLTKNLDVTYSMVWSVALANILGAGICYAFSQQFAKLAILRYTLILPPIMAIVYLGAFQGQRQWGDLYALLFFGTLGWAMKQLKWPRPPMVLGFVLGDLLERYLFISVERYGTDWIWQRPVVVVMLGIAALGLLRPFMHEVKAEGGVSGMLLGMRRFSFPKDAIFTAGFLVLVAVMLSQAFEWNYDARIIPVIVGVAALVFAGLSLMNQVLRGGDKVAHGSEGIIQDAQRAIHMDISSEGQAHLTVRVIVQRGLIFFGWLVAYMGSMAAIGVLATTFVFMVSYMRIEGREPWKLCLINAVAMVFFTWLLFDHFLTIPWPYTYLGDLFPHLREIVPSL